ncbi:hypothetical protein ACWD7F_32465 [Streptomyces sp. NPDC005122]
MWTGSGYDRSRVVKGVARVADHPEHFVCFDVPGEVARKVKRLSHPGERVAALTAYFEEQLGSGQAGQIPGAEAAVPGVTTHHEEWNAFAARDEDGTGSSDLIDVSGDLIPLGGLPLSDTFWPSSGFPEPAAVDPDQAGQVGAAEQLASPSLVDAALGYSRDAVQALEAARVVWEQEQERHGNRDEGSSSGRPVGLRAAAEAVERAELGVFGARQVLSDLGVDLDSLEVSEAELLARPGLRGGAPGSHPQGTDRGTRGPVRSGPVGVSRRGPGSYWRDVPASASDMVRIRYAAEAAVFEHRLGDYLITREASLRALRAAARIVVDHLRARAPERIPELGDAEPGSAGAVGDDPRVLQEVARSGNTREVILLLQYSRHALEGIVASPRFIPEIEAERPLRIIGDRMLTRQRPQDVIPPLSPAEYAFSVRRDPVTGTERLLWTRAEYYKSLKVREELHQRGQDTGGLVKVGTSGTTYLILDMVRNIAASAGQNINMHDVLLGTMGFLLSTGLHTVHEIMRSAQLWDAAVGGAYKLHYVDGWSRYRHIPGLSESELPEHVAVDGLFPDEIALGLTPPPVEGASSTGVEALKALGIDPASWSAYLDATAAAGGSKVRPGSRLEAWSELWHTIQRWELAREEEMRLRDVGRAPNGRAQENEAGEAWHRATLTVEWARQQGIRLAQALQQLGHDPLVLVDRFKVWAAEQQPRALRARHTDAAGDELARLAQQQLRISGRPGQRDPLHRTGGARDTGLDPTGLPLGHALVVEGPRTGGVVTAGHLVPSAPREVAAGKRPQGRSWTRFELPDPHQPEASFGYEVGDTGEIRLYLGEQTRVLPARGWIAYGDDFLHLGEGMLLRGDTGWIGRIGNWDILRDTLGGLEPTHRVHSDGRAVHVLPYAGISGSGIRLPLIPVGTGADLGFRERVALAKRAWETGKPDAVRELEDLLKDRATGGPGSRSLVIITAPDGSNTASWAVNYEGVVRWQDNRGQEVPAPQNRADEVIKSIDLNPQSQLIRAPQLLKAAGAEATSFCTLTLGVDLSDLMR